MKYWKPWITETRDTINNSAKWVFASLILSILVLGNIALIVFVLAYIKYLVQ